MKKILYILATIALLSCEKAPDSSKQTKPLAPIEVIENVAGYIAPEHNLSRTHVDSTMVFRYSFTNDDALDLKVKVEAQEEDMKGRISHNDVHLQLNTPFNTTIQNGSVLEFHVKTLTKGSNKFKIVMSSDDFKTSNNTKEFYHSFTIFDRISTVKFVGDMPIVQMGELTHLHIGVFDNFTPPEESSFVDVKAELLGGKGGLMLDTIGSHLIQFEPQVKPTFIKTNSKSGFYANLIVEEETTNQLSITVKNHNEKEENHILDLTSVLPGDVYFVAYPIDYDGGIHDLGKTKPFCISHTTIESNTYVLDVDGFGVSAEQLSRVGQDTVYLTFPSYGTHDIEFVITDKFGVVSKKSLQYEVWETFKHKLEFDQPITDYNSAVHGYLGTMGTTVDADIYKCAYKSDVPMKMMCYGELIEPMQLMESRGAIGLPVSFEVSGEGHDLKAANTFKMSLHIISKHTDMWYEYDVNIPAHHLSLEMPKSITTFYNSHVGMPTTIPFKMNSSRRSPNMTIKVNYDESKGSIVYLGDSGMTSVKSGQIIRHDIDVSFLHYFPNKIGESDIKITLADSNGFDTSASTTVNVIQQDVILEVDTLAKRRYFNDDLIRIPLVLRSTEPTTREILFNSTAEGYLLYEGRRIERGQVFTVPSVHSSDTPPLIEFKVKGYADYTLSFEMEDNGKTVKHDRSFYVPCHLSFRSEGPGSTVIYSDVSNLESLYNVGDIETIVSAPNDNAIFVGWYENGVKISDEKDLTITIYTDRDIIGKFEYVK